MFQEEVRDFQGENRPSARYIASTYKSLLRTVFKNRRLRIESEDNTYDLPGAGFGGDPVEPVRHRGGRNYDGSTYDEGCLTNRSIHESEQNQYVLLLKRRSPAARLVSTCILQTGSIAYSREQLGRTISYKSTG